jgi:hypothetical protein
LQRHERYSSLCQRQGRANAQQRNAKFEQGVDPQGSGGAVGKSAEYSATQCQPSKKAANPSCDSVNIDTDYQGQLLDPDCLVNQRRQP